MEVAVATAGDVEQAISEVGIPLISDLLRNNILGQVFANDGLTKMSEYLTQTLLTSALNVVSFIVMFAVIYMAVLLLVNLLNNVFRFPILRHFDWLLGGAFGIIRGAVIVMLIFAVMPTLSSALESMGVDMLGELMNESRLGSFLQNNNVVANLLHSLVS
jgi:uncharacterized membrane protein required for colicin V production